MIASFRLYREGEGELGRGRQNRSTIEHKRGSTQRNTFLRLREFSANVAYNKVPILCVSSMPDSALLN